MDEKTKSLTTALRNGGASFVGIIVFYMLFAAPIQDHQTEKFLQECSELNLECTVDINWIIPFGLAIIPFMVFVATYMHMENKRLKTWRSYK